MDAAFSRLSDFDYALDPSLVALAPNPLRDHCRLLVYDRKRRQIAHRRFKDLPDYLGPLDLLVTNNTRVFPARLRGRKQNGGRLELLFLRPFSGSGSETGHLLWEVLAKGRIRPPLDLSFEDRVSGRILEDLGAGRKLLCLELSESPFPGIHAFLERWGEVPLPPYILKQRPEKDPFPEDSERYQTLFARHSGSAAAPTAGLHFSERLLKSLENLGLQRAETTLHIGLGTFRPIACENIQEHKMHREWFRVSEATAGAVNAARDQKGRVFAVGTTVVRALESALAEDGRSKACEGETDLFIMPGYRFQATDALITNFHLPKSSLLVLVSAFAGCAAVQKIYREAIQERYRFYSYGDAMLIL